jgi:hypothetical protein
MQDSDGNTLLHATAMARQGNMRLMDALQELGARP